ncbi:O-antigen ligase family protein [Halomonas sp. LC1]|uniref:O-antigen ligase family protein n=1 Tax=Halomonas sp. LC1 TaxID=3043733 RepID=UPI002557228C|nr:O-antigen ligase family protein [Halomonas sp. LC1]MDK9688114.1 O-antigen ligase family protein [Halomonas sp. LC1]
MSKALTAAAIALGMAPLLVPNGGWWLVSGLGAVWLARQLLRSRRGVWALMPAVGLCALALSGGAMGAWAIAQTLLGGSARAAGHAPMHAILFGNLSLVCGLVSMAGLAWAWHQPKPKRWVWWLLFGFGAVGGVMASVLSGTRGGWLALPFAGLVFYRVYIGRWAGWKQGVLAAGVCILLVSAYALPQTGVQTRVASAVEETRDYWQGHPHGSIGVRLELYRVTLMLIAQRPLTGYRLAEYQDALQTLQQKGDISPQVARHWHAHNDLLNAWVRYGVLGLLGVILLYAWPLWWFSRSSLWQQPAQRPLVLAGLLLPILFIDFGLSYAFFAYPVVLATYVGWVVLLQIGVKAAQFSARRRAPFS